jgi:hypothetical protein
MNNDNGFALEGELLGTVSISVANSTPRLRSADFMAQNERFNFTRDMLNMDYGIRSARMEGVNEPIECPDGQVWNGTACVVPLPSCGEGYHHVWNSTECELDTVPRYNKWSRWSFGASSVTSLLSSSSFSEANKLKQSFILEMDHVSGDMDGLYTHPATGETKDFHQGGFHTNEYNTNTVRMHGHWGAEMSGLQTASGNWWEGNAKVYLGGQYSCTSTFDSSFTGNNWQSRSMPTQSQLTNYELKAWMSSDQDEIVNSYSNTPLNSKQASSNWQETAPLINAPAPQSSGGSNSMTCSPETPCENAAGSMGFGLSIIGLLAIARRKMK